MDSLKQLTGNLGARLGGLSFNQKVLLGVVLTASIISVSVFSMWLQKEDKAVLYSNLSPEDAAAALEELAKQDVPTELKNGGGTILVPESQVARLRIDLAGKGVVANGPVGFEIFDGKQYGLTEFLQNVNFKRALEGELTKSILSLQGIQQARVHLVLPQPSIFKKEDNGATASVVLRLGRGAKLSESQIAGIQALVAGSVENLRTDAVTVIDQSGRVLSAAPQDEDMGRNESQLGLRKDVEAYLTEKAGSMLDKVLGPGRSIVRVDATLNFEKLTRDREIYDPASTVVRSEVRNEEVDAQGGTNENSTTNYEINRTVEHIVGQTGNIANLSVSVFVDGHYEPAADGKGEPTYTPLTDDELGQLKRVVQTAVGLNSVRGDQIELVNMQFRQLEEPPAASPLTDWMSLVTEYGGKALLLVLLVVMALSLRRSLGRLLAGPAPQAAVAAAARGVAGGAASGRGAAAEPQEVEHFDGIPELNDQVVGDIRDYAADNPDRVAEVIQSWIREIDVSGGSREMVES